MLRSLHRCSCCRLRVFQMAYKVTLTFVYVSGVMHESSFSLDFHSIFAPIRLLVPSNIIIIIVIMLREKSSSLNKIELDITRKKKTERERRGAEQNQLIFFFLSLSITGTLLFQLNSIETLDCSPKRRRTRAFL